jgi:oligopeptidase A
LVAADVYSAFDEVKNNDDEIKKIGKRFRETFLSLGGSIHPSEVFRRFRGRDPCHKALVKNLGLSQYANTGLANDENVKK